MFRELTFRLGFLMQVECLEYRGPGREGGKRRGGGAGGWLFVVLLLVVDVDGIAAFGYLRRRLRCSGSDVGGGGGGGGK